jgi:hypothetical protein
VFGHHWVGKGILSAALWLFISFIPIKSEFKTRTLLMALIVGSLAVSAYYIIHFIA